VALFGGAAGKVVVNRVFRKLQGDWEAWNRRPLADEPIVLLILDGTVIPVRFDRKATSISLLVVLGLRDDGGESLAGRQDMGGETAEAWRAVLDDLARRGPRRPNFSSSMAALACRAAGGPLGRRPDAALHGPQASQSVRQPKAAAD